MCRAGSMPDACGARGGACAVCASDSLCIDGACTLIVGADGGTVPLGRIKLTAPLTLYVSPTGDDVSGDGTMGKPWKTRARAWLALKTDYDLNCESVTIRLLAGTHTDSFQPEGPPLLGQCGAGSITFSGDPMAPKAVVAQPALGAGYVSSAAYGTQYTLANMVLDQGGQKGNEAVGFDTISIGQGSSIVFGPGLTFGFNVHQWNHVSVDFGAYVEFDGDFTIDPGSGQAAKISGYGMGTNVINVADTTGIVQFMGIVSTAPGLPSDAFVQTIGPGTQVTFGCLLSSPCETTQPASGVNVLFTGGGQCFLDMGNGAQGYFATNGQADSSVIATLSNYPYYFAGFFFINDLSAINAEGITFVNPGLARGQCSVTTGNAVTDTGFQGVPYLPCDAAGAHSPFVAATLTQGSRQVTVSSAAGIQVGNQVNGLATPTASFTAGSNILSVSSTDGTCVGARVTGPGILTGAVVTSVGAGTLTLGPCPGFGPKCVNNFPTFESQSGASLYVAGCGVTNGTVVTDVQGNTVTISKAPASSGTQNLFFQGQVTFGGIAD
jgi:hypothetical protein